MSATAIKPQTAPDVDLDTSVACEWQDCQAEATWWSYMACCKEGVALCGEHEAATTAETRRAQDWGGMACTSCGRYPTGVNRRKL